MIGKNKKQEQGRTMVEILGVLAIGGVLAIVSVAGLRLAFEKNTANELVHEMSQRAVLVSAAKVNNKEVNLDEFANTSFAEQYKITYNDSEADGFFSITMENVTDETVRSLKEMGWDLPYTIYINGVPLEDYDAEKNAPKTSFFKQMFVKSAMAAGKGNNVIKFVFENKLDKKVKPPRIDEETCLKTSGKWDGERCFCPTGSYMTKGGCVTKCGGNTGIDCPTETICYRDNECRGCLEVCSNGKCVVDNKNTCNGVPHCEGSKIVTCIMNGSKDTACATNTASKDCAMYGTNMTCSEENGEAKCVLKDVCEDGNICLEGPDAGRCTTDCRCDEAAKPDGGDAWECDPWRGSWECFGTLCETGPDKGKCMYECQICSEGKTELCSEHGDCICVPEGYSAECNWYECIACAPEEGIAKCSEHGYCICVPEGYSEECNWYECIACAPEEGIAKCSEEGYCICGPEGYSAECSRYECIACAPSEGIAMCSEHEDCICVPEGYSAECNGYECIACAPEEGIAKCSGYGNCICVPEGYSAECSWYECIACAPSEGIAKCSENGECFCEQLNLCSETSRPIELDGDAWACELGTGEWYCSGKICETGSDKGKCMHECQTCSEGKTELCSEDGDCICVPEGYSSDCSMIGCRACSPAEGKAMCSEFEECICVPDGYSADCNWFDCITCSPEEGIAMCSEDGDCICVPDGYSAECNWLDCILCSPEEGTAKCSEDGDCICVPDGCSASCGAMSCIACAPSGGTAKCSEFGDCICVPDGYSAECSWYECIACAPEEGTAKCLENDECFCEQLNPCSETSRPIELDGDAWACELGTGEWYCSGKICETGSDKGKCMHECQTCSEGKTELCSEFGDCICVPDGYSASCGAMSCIVCSPSEGRAMCSEQKCACIPDGYDGACNMRECITCSPEEGTAKCSENGECICVPDGYSASCGETECIVCNQGKAVCTTAGCSCEIGCDPTTKPDDGDAWECGKDGWWNCMNMCTFGPDEGKCKNNCDCGLKPDNGDGWSCANLSGYWHCDGSYCEAGPDEGKCMHECRCDSGCIKCDPKTGVCLI